MANIFKKASKFVKKTAKAVGKSGVLSMLPVPGAGIISNTAGKLAQSSTASKSKATEAPAPKASPAAVQKSASQNVKNTSMANEQVTPQEQPQNDTIKKAMEWAKKNWYILAGAGVAAYFLLSKKKRRR